MRAHGQIEIFLDPIFSGGSDKRIRFRTPKVTIPSVFRKVRSSARWRDNAQPQARDAPITSAVAVKDHTVLYSVSLIIDTAALTAWEGV